MLRMILPKRTTFEFLTQWDVNLITSHINSTPWESLNGRTPYDVALETFGEDVLKAFQLRRIDPIPTFVLDTPGNGQTLWPAGNTFRRLAATRSMGL